MKKLFLFMTFLGVTSSVRGAELRPQFRVWKSSVLQCGNYANVLISSTPIIFHVVMGSPTLNQGGNSYFALNFSTGFPFAAPVSTKAFVPLDQANSGLGLAWDVVTSTSLEGHAFSWYQKQGGACPVHYLWDYWQRPMEPFSNNYFPGD